MQIAFLNTYNYIFKNLWLFIYKWQILEGFMMNREMNVDVNFPRFSDTKSNIYIGK